MIAEMLREQERARASRAELLNVQAAHLTQIGDQWPAFQELQVGGRRLFAIQYQSCRSSCGVALLLLSRSWSLCCLGKERVTFVYFASYGGLLWGSMVS